MSVFLRRGVVVVAVWATTSLPVGAPTARADADAFPATVAPFLKQHCLECHGAAKAEGELKLDNLVATAKPGGGDPAIWGKILERLLAGDMPPEEKPRPAAEAREAVVAWLRGEMARLGQKPPAFSDRDFPRKGNLVPHELLFPAASAPPASGSPALPAATPARLWRISPFAYRTLVDEQTRGFVGILRGKVEARGSPLVAPPFGLTSDHEFRDYAFRYQVSASETEQLALNARKTLELMLQSRGPRKPPRELASIAEASVPPTADQIERVVVLLFAQVLRRDPTGDELARYTGFLSRNIEKLGNRQGLIVGLSPVFLHPETVFRLELGQGRPDDSGRALLAPLELAMGISYALTDRRPDSALTTAAQQGRLQSRDDVCCEVVRLLDDPAIDKPRILRFFQEYFGYTLAPEVFKDDAVSRAAGFPKYRPESLVEDTDRLVLHILERDRDVLRDLLTTNLTFVDSSGLPNWLKFADRRQKAAAAAGTQAPTHPFGKDNRLHLHYNFDPARWSSVMPLQLPPTERAGILTQPAWLIAHSANTDNHAILRGKWIRERLLGGAIPDTPITVEAKLPEEPNTTLRHRMRVTREEYCWKCHQRMDPLGLPFEMYDHFGQYRTLELGQPVDVSGAIVASGDSRLDGPVTGALELIRRLADSERVQQVFVRHAFRYWLGRNETPADAAVLQAANREYAASGGSFRALLVSLLTSDAFLYRTVELSVATLRTEEPSR
ncbi:MAG: DUF1588 domain-containing protein [Pirellulaceae bacterium]|nr:DUF1588 domain-containing protein [Pirellulaceae bacterium]